MSKSEFVALLKECDILIKPPPKKADDGKDKKEDKKGAKDESTKMV